MIRLKFKEILIFNETREGKKSKDARTRIRLDLRGADSNPRYRKRYNVETQSGLQSNSVINYDLIDP